MDAQAAEIERANAELASFVRSCSAEDWCWLVADEGWPVGVLLHHAAVGNTLVEGWIRAASRGEAITVTAEEIDDDNARHAARFAAVSPAEVLDAVDERGRAIARLVRSLSDEDLATEAAFGPAGGRRFSAGQLCQAAAAHIRNHLAHARAALDRSG